MKRTHSNDKKNNYKQIKITSIFPRVSDESPKNSKINLDNNGDQTPKSQSFSSPDIIPPSPVLEKKKKIKAKRNLNYVKVIEVEREDKSTLLQTNEVIIPIPKETLNLVMKTPDNPDEVKSEIDSQSFNCTESIASTNCDETDFCSDLFFDDWNDSPAQKDIDLTIPQRCIVKSIEKNFAKINLTLNLCKSSDELCVCCLSGIWLQSFFEVGDIVTVLAIKSNDIWSVNNNHGYVTRHSDILVSGTAIVGSLFCSRRSVLANIYQGLDNNTAIMVMGTLLHQFLQTVLMKNKFDYKDIEAVVDEMVSSPSFVHTLYGTDMNLETTKKELIEFIPKIQSFIRTYIIGYKPNNNDKKTWEGEVVSVLDMEENIWVPEFGMKGKIDITVKTKCDGKIKIMPIELKTGRASGSAEHRGQVILYVIMMAELGMDVDSGLLLYLRENILTQVKVEHKEKRDLIMLRNRLVHYLNANKIVSDSIENYIPVLPEPISHHNACLKCPYLTTCSAVLSKEGFEKLDQQNPLKSLGPQAISHLKPEHIDYVMQWTAFLYLENCSKITNSSNVKTIDIWTIPVDKRAQNGDCITSLKISKAVKEQGTKYYLHTMERSDKSYQNNFKHTNFSVNNYLIVSTNDRIAISTGFISAITETSVDLLLDRDLTKLKPSLYHLDKYESQSITTFNFSSIALLLEPSENSARLRQFIIDKEIPSFLSTDSHISSFIKSTGLSLDLNSSQNSAITKALAATNYVLIKGMPGTGKTSTVVTLIKLLVLMGRSVLVTSFTHSAVDNLLLLLDKSGVDFLRLGSNMRIHPDLWGKSESEVSKNCDTPEKLSNLYSQVKVVGVTCLGCGHPLLQKRTFDVCVVDEATQVPQASVIAALYSAKIFILVGDPQQLPPLIKNKRAKELGMDVSMFERLDRPSVTAVLHNQYRMNGPITELANKYTYNGGLYCANDKVKYSTINLNCDKINLNVSDKWLKDVISSDIEKSVLFLDTGTVDSNSLTYTNLTDTNLTEIKIIKQIVIVLIEGGISAKSIGVIAPYRAQVSLLNKNISCIHLDIEVNTVDQYQGRDKDVIIYSCTKHTDAKNAGILSDKRRITVAITRAKQKLIMIGDVTTMKNYETFNRLLDHIPNIIKIPQI